MKKIPSLFKRDYEGTRLVYDEVVEGSEWVLNGEGVATEKLDGTSCMIKDGKLYKRFDRKITRRPKRHAPPYAVEEFKPAPAEWIACEEAPNIHTGHWPGWLPVGTGPEDAIYREAFNNRVEKYNGTYELVGPKVQGNPYKMNYHALVRHGSIRIIKEIPLSFEGIKKWLEETNVEGIVWHHPDGRTVKIKRKDFGLDWPIP